jgi:hypothetical protein
MEEEIYDDDFAAATERINAGADIHALPPSVIELMWEAISRIPQEKDKTPPSVLEQWLLVIPPRYRKTLSNR